MKKSCYYILLCCLMLFFLASCSSGNSSITTPGQYVVISTPFSFYDIASEIHYNLALDRNCAAEFEVPVYSNIHLEKELIENIRIASDNEKMTADCVDVQYAGMSSPNCGTDEAYVINYVKIKVEMTDSSAIHGKVHISSVDFDVDVTHCCVNTDINIYYFDDLLAPSRAFAALQIIDLFTTEDNANVSVVSGDMSEDVVVSDYHTLSDYASVTKSVWKNSNDVILEVASPNCSLTVRANDYHKAIFGDFGFELNGVNSPWYVDTLVLKVRYASETGNTEEGTLTYTLRINCDLEKYQNEIYQQIEKLKNDK